MANAWYTNGQDLVRAGSVIWASDTFKVMLVTSSYTFSAAHTVVTTPAAAEVTGTNYARKTLASVSVDQNASGVSRIHCSNFLWSALTTNAAAAALILFKFVSNDAGSLLLAYIDTPNFPFLSTAADVTLTVDATNGIVRV